MSEPEARAMMRKLQLPDYVIDGLIDTFDAVRAGRLDFCTDDVQRVTGKPPRSFETWLQNHLGAFQ
jgi:hypothetical protein